MREQAISTAPVSVPTLRSLAGNPSSNVPVLNTPSGSTAPLVSAPVKRPNVFGLSGAVRLEDVPAGRFHDELARLSEPARQYALEKLGRLQVPLNDVASLSVEENGQLFYQCDPPRLPPKPQLSAVVPREAQAGVPSAPVTVIAAASVPIATPPIRHSRPGSTKVIYLDFNGQTITGTSWNNQKGNVGDANYRQAVASYVAKAFDIDNNPTSFSDAEQTIIVQVWERVAEDYKGFDVDVTTEQPATFTATTGRILITNNVDANGVNMPASTASGVAYIDVFGSSNYVSTYSPALVYANQNYNNEAYIAEAASHEMGHNLSLSHDGTTTGDEYYNGHGTGETSWNTLMAAAYDSNVTQWSKGEYYNANNPEDDLAIIAGHLGYVPDDHTDSNASATPLTVSGLNVSGSGIISQTGEADRFSFNSGPGVITLNATTFRSASHTNGGNLDVALELYYAGGSMVASANVDGVTNSTLSTTVAGGTYFLRVYGASSGDPLSSSPTGYTNYGSLGQYTISGTVISTTPVLPSFTSQPSSQTVYAGQAVQFTVAANGYPAPTYQWKKNGANIGGAISSTFSITSAVVGDAGSYTCVATNSSGPVASNVASLTVTPTSLPSFTIQPVSQAILEGSSVSFTAVAVGVPNPTYQWQKGGVNINGATGSTYTIATTAAGDAGSYMVVASNLAGFSSSTTVALTINSAPVISGLSPSRIMKAPGQILNLTVNTTEVGLVSYQWTHNGLALAGATSSNLSLPNLRLIDGGWYAVSVTNSFGTRRSSPIFVSVAPVTTEIRGWGSNGYWELAIPSGLTDVIAIAAGDVTALALKRDGTVVAWGRDWRYSGNINVPTGLSDVVAIAAGPFHSLALKSDGTVVSWGGIAQPPAGLNNVVAIAANELHSLALKSDGTVVVWGDSRTAVPVGLANAISIAAPGRDASLVLKDDGSVFYWDTSLGGQAFVPASFSNVTAISAGPNHALALKSNGTVVAWGFSGNNSPLNEVPINLSGVVAIDAGGNHSLALKNDGTVFAWGSNDSGQATIPSNLANVIAISAGTWFSLVLRDTTLDTQPVIVTQPANKTVLVEDSVTFSIVANSGPQLTYQWRKGGINIPGATGSSLTLSNLTLANSGPYDVVVTNSLGVVNSVTAMLVVNPRPIITSLSPVRQVLIPGQALSLSVTATGNGALTYQWIHNGLTLNGANDVNLSRPSAGLQDNGWYQVLVTDTFGTRRSSAFFVTIAPAVTAIRGWGYNAYGVTDIPSGLAGAIACSASDGFFALALKRDGTVAAWGNSYLGQTIVPAGLSNIVSISAGYYHALALKSDGTVVAWGDNGSGQTNVPVGLTGVVAIAAGNNHSVALKDDGTVVSWGTTYQNAGNTPSGLSNVIAIAAGGNYLLALKSDRTVVGWGENTLGQTNPPSGLTGIAAISAGPNHVLALKSDGAVVAWGYAGDGAINVPNALGTVKDISAGLRHSIVLKSNGNVVGWGIDGYGETTQPTDLANVLSVAAGADYSLALRDASLDTVPLIVTQPVNQDRAETQSATFNVSVTGAGPTPINGGKTVPISRGLLLLHSRSAISL